jgi:hypothetical protein
MPMNPLPIIAIFVLLVAMRTDLFMNEKVDKAHFCKS